MNEFGTMCKWVLGVHGVAWGMMNKIWDENYIFFFFHNGIVSFAIWLTIDDRFPYKCEFTSSKSFCLIHLRQSWHISLELLIEFEYILNAPGQKICNNNNKMAPKLRTMMMKSMTCKSKIDNQPHQLLLLSNGIETGHS